MAAAASGRSSLDDGIGSPKDFGSNPSFVPPPRQSVGSP
jgi:hypothetical protein